MSFVEECVKDSLPIWESCLQTDFLRCLADGTLDEACFRGYIVEDSLYLREYAKVFAWGIIHAQTLDELRTFYGMMSYVSLTEGTTRHLYLEKFGLSDEKIQAFPLRAPNRRYLDEMLAACQNARTSAVCIIAALPCMLSYQWIFEQMLHRSPEARSGPYGLFVKDYEGEDYKKVCGEWIVFADALCEKLTAAEKEDCRRLFHSLSQREYDFWKMSEQPRSDC